MFTKFNSVEEADAFLHEFELRTATKYITVKVDKGFGSCNNDDVKKRNHKTYYKATVSTVVGPFELPYTTIPFFIGKTKMKDCKMGADRHISYKQKLKERRDIRMMAEQNRIVKSRITKPSAKKVNCPAQIIFKEVITFPDYEVWGGGSRRDEFEMSRQLRTDIIMGKSVRMVKFIYMSEPAEHHHHNHPVGQCVETAAVAPKPVVEAAGPSADSHDTPTAPSTSVEWLVSAPQGGDTAAAAMLSLPDGGGGRQLLNVDDIMNVVYSYRCRFCSFAADSSSEVTLHVVSHHLTRHAAEVESVAAAEVESVSVAEADSADGSGNVAIVDGIVADQTVVYQTVADETVMEQTVTDPVCTDPVCTDQTMTEETIVVQQVIESQTESEPAVVDHVVMDQTVTDQTVMEQTVTDQTVMDQTVADQTVMEQTVTDQTVMEQTVTDQTVMDQMVPEQTVMEQTVTDQTVVEQTVLDSTTANETATHQIVYDHTTTGQTVIEQIVFDHQEQTVTDQTVIEQAVLEHAAIEQAGAENAAEIDTTHSVVLEAVVNQLVAMVTEMQSVAVDDAATGNAVDLNGTTDVVEVNMPIQQQEECSEETEVFLCGQCNLAFNSIDDCKQHMVNDHGIPLSAMSSEPAPPSEPEEQYSHTTSVATQVSIQKTRKRKAARTVSSDDEATFSVDEDDNFESLISTQPFRSSSRRQIRPPKALCEDYYLGQQKVGKRHATSSRRRPVTPDPTPTLKCDLAGCSARFTTDESLTLHRQCHVGGGSGLKNKFRCVVCQVAFCYWWPLRLHLWREHDRLMDFACDFRTACARKMNTSADSTSDANSRTCEVCKRQYTEESATANSTTTKETGGAICDNDKKRQCDICRQNLTDEPRLQNEVEVPGSNENEDALRSICMKAEISTSPVH